MDYSKLTNNELDRLIAERRGWKFIGGKYWCWFVGGYEINQLHSCPSFTTDPRYAMELLEELLKKGSHLYFNLTRKLYEIDGIENKELYRAISEAYAQWKGEK